MKSHDIKNKLEERRIEVSENSWEKLASQLDANDQRKKRKNFYPYAACLALLVGFIVFMTLKTETAIGTETVVKTEVKSNNTDSKVKSQQNIIPKETENILTTKMRAVTQKSTSKIHKNEVVRNKIIPQQKQQLAVELHKEVQNTVVVQKTENLPKEIKTIITEKEVVVANSNEDLKASILALSATEKIAITDKEIDQLLKEAKASIRDLDMQKDVDITTFATADELLQEVEFELDRSFKQKVFDLIKKNIRKGKTLLADRN